MSVFILLTLSNKTITTNDQQSYKGTNSLTFKKQIINKDTENLKTPEKHLTPHSDNCNKMNDGYTMFR